MTKHLLLLAGLVVLTGCPVNQDHPQSQIESMTWTVTTKPEQVVPQIHFKEVTERQTLFVKFGATEVVYIPRLDHGFLLRDTNGSVWFAAFEKDGNAIKERVQIFEAQAPRLIEIPEDPDQYALEHGITNNSAMEKAMREIEDNLRDIHSNRLHEVEGSWTNREENP